MVAGVEVGKRSPSVEAGTQDQADEVACLHNRLLACLGTKVEADDCHGNGQEGRQKGQVVGGWRFSWRASS